MELVRFHCRRHFVTQHHCQSTTRDRCAKTAAGVPCDSTVQPNHYLTSYDREYHCSSTGTALYRVLQSA
jgi:hypothetical protein